MDLDFEGVAAAALRAASTLLPQWVGGKRVGNEWVAARRAEGGPGDSWSINLNTGVWSHFASGAKGHDIIGFYAELHHISQGAAQRQISDQLGINGKNVPVLPYAAPAAPAESKSICEPIPNDPPALRDHPSLGPATATYQYGNAFVVTRYDTPEGKTFSQWTWRNGHWVNKGYGADRPLFHVELLAKNPGAKVLVVEGEKCVEVAQPRLRSYVLVTWAGGSSAWRQTDWSSLAGREVHIWPDADDAGRKAASDISAYLTDICPCVRVINPNGADPGWDIADAVNLDGWDGNRICDFVKEHIEAPITKSKSKSTSQAKPDPDGSHNQSPTSVVTNEEPSAPVSWESLGLDCAGGKVPTANIANSSRIIQLYRNFKGHVWFDDFRGEIYHTLHSPVPTPWTDRDTRKVTVAIQQQLRLHKFHESIVRDGIQHAAECNTRNSLTEYLNSLKWDGVERLGTWLSDCAGVELTEHSQAVARNWPIAMVARAFKPGCKMDNIPVLEGMSGLNKSQFLEVLGGEWYEALPMEFGTKDFLQNLRGVWLAEIPDMTGFDKADHSRVIAMLSIPRDKYRRAYGRDAERHLRVTMFAATSEDSDYLLDRRGKRRFWPVRCTSIDLNTLRNQRDQIFAEAVIKYKEGARWFDMPASTTDEQNARMHDETWILMISEYVNAIWEQQKRQGDPKGITMSDILGNGLKIPADRQGMREQRRAANVMRSLSWRDKHTNLGNIWLKTERRDKDQ